MKTNTKNWILLILLLFSFHFSQAQGTGLILEDETYHETPEVPVAFSSGSKLLDLPLKYSLKQHCPVVINQGQVGSCVGWSTGYGAFTIMQAQKEGWTDEKKITENAFSAMYIYNQVKLGDCGQGSLFSAALKLLQTDGDCLSKDFDYPMNDCHRKPKMEHKLAAQKAKYEVRDYYTLFKSVDKAKEKENKVKVSISEGKPVIIGMLIRENFKHLVKEDKYWNPETGDKASAGGHAMTIVGYNDGKNAFEVMNSWGKDWGNDGYFWLKYDDFAKYCVYGYQLVIKKKRITEAIVNNTTTTDPFAPNSAKDDNVEEADIVELGAEFVFRYPFFDEETDELSFQETKTAFNGKCYELKSTNWEENQRFQLLSREITKDRYVYVFSIDPDNKSRIHWPRNKKYDQKFVEFNEAAIVPYDDVEIIVPGKESAMIKDKSGVDYLFVLYSDEPIDDLIERIEDIKNNQDDYIEGLNNSFGNRLIPTTDIDYELNKMKFTTISSSGGYITPVILKIETQN